MLSCFKNLATSGKLTLCIHFQNSNLCDTNKDFNSAFWLLESLLPSRPELAIQGDISLVSDQLRGLLSFAQNQYQSTSNVVRVSKSCAAETVRRLHHKRTYRYLLLCVLVCPL